MKNFFIFLAVIVSQYSVAHTRWIVASHTILSGDKPEYVSFDFSVSNDIFYPDHAYGGIALQSLSDKQDVELADKTLSGMEKIMASTQLQVQLPDGSIINDTPIVDFGRKSSSLFLLEQSGTYRISVNQNPIHYVSFKKINNTEGRLFGSLAGNKQRIPEGASDVVETRLINTVQTYVTRNAVTALKTQSHTKGLALTFNSHPNELFVGELFQAALLVDGEAVVKGTEIRVTREDTRFRNNRQVQIIKADAAGRFSFIWDKAGIYLLESEVEMDGRDTKSQKIIYALFITLEVSQE